MIERLEGKVAVVTGGASGIGRAMGERFARAGMKVVLADVEAPALDATVAALQDDGLEVSGVVTNLLQNRYDIFGGFNVNQGNPAGPTVERFLTPGSERMFRLIVRTSLGGARTAGGVDPD